MEKKKATEAAQNKTLNPNDTSASNARAIIIQALRAGPQTTIDLRERWGIMAPAPRVLELRLRGYIIASVPVVALTADGIRHCGVARYCLIGEPPDATEQREGDVIAPERATSACGIAGAA